MRKMGFHLDSSLMESFIYYNVHIVCPAFLTSSSHVQYMLTIHRLPWGDFRRFGIVVKLHWKYVDLD